MVIFIKTYSKSDPANSAFYILGDLLKSKANYITGFLSFSLSIFFFSL